MTVSVDGKLAGLFIVITRGDEGPKAFQVVGQFADGLICRPLSADGTSTGSCPIITEKELFEATKDGTALFFADDRSALRHLKEMTGAEAIEANG